MSTTKRCWEVFKCTVGDCPAYGEDEVCCWLMDGVRPRVDIHGKYLVPMEACLKCTLFKAHAGDKLIDETFHRIREQFGLYRKEVQKRTDIQNVRLTSVNERLQRQLADKEAAEQACLTVNEELNNFIRTISHDLKAPIISIQGFSSRLLKSEGRHLSQKGRGALKQIAASADRMETLVLDLLHLSQVGTADCRLQKTAMQDMIYQVIASLGDMIGKYGARIVIADRFPQIMCDEDQMFQVLENLVVNAIKFSKQTEFPTVEIGYANRPEYHLFYVRDNGIGIDPRYHQEIFDMFRRLKEIKDDKGTGLGLAIVQRIITRHGGRVWVDSKKGKGATFYFTVPKKGVCK